MTVPASTLGFPGTRRSPRLSLPDFQGKRLSLPANDVTRGILPFEEQGIRRAVAEAAERAAAKRFMNLGLRIVPYLGEALLLYDTYELVMGTPGEVIPGTRDPHSASDTDITVPSSWSTYDCKSSWQGSETAYGYPAGTVLSGGFRYASGFSTGMWIDADPFPGSLVTEYPVEQIVSGCVSSFTKWQELSEPDAYGHGGLATHTYYERNFPSTSSPSFANEVADVVVPGTVTIMPMFVPLPPPTFVGRTVNPDLSPWEQPQWGPGRVSDPLPWEVGSPQPEPSPLPVTPPTVVITPGQGVSPSPGTRPVSPPLPSPPGGGVKEKKVRIRYGGVVQAVRAVAGEFTEFLDVMNAFWWALPPEYRTGYGRTPDGKVFRKFKASVTQRWADVYRNFAHVDPMQLVKNIVRMELTDRAIGKFNQRLARTYENRPDLHNRPGLMVGPWDTSAGSILTKG